MHYYGFTENEWNAAKSEIRSVLVSVAKKEETITYSDLTSQLRSVKLEPNQYALFEILGEISSEEHKAGRGMLTAVVITIEGGMPGSGFFDLAESLGYTIVDKVSFWVFRLKEVHEYWSGV